VWSGASVPAVPGAVKTRTQHTGPPALDGLRRRCYGGRVTSKSFTVECPCCKAKLTLDPELRAVIAHEPPPPTRTVADLGGALDKLRRRSAQIEERFRQGVEAEGQKGKVLDRKFQEGLKKAKDSPDPPKRPFDYE